MSVFFTVLLLICDPSLLQVSLGLSTCRHFCDTEASEVAPTSILLVCCDAVVTSPTEGDGRLRFRRRR